MNSTPDIHATSNPFKVCIYQENCCKFSKVSEEGLSGQGLGGRQSGCLLTALAKSFLRLRGAWVAPLPFERRKEGSERRQKMPRQKN